MTQELVTKALDESTIRSELDNFIAYYVDSGVGTCEILFGFAWGINYYDNNNWTYEVVEVKKISQKLQFLEEKKFGRLSDDDLYINVNNIEFLFCHEADIHIRYEQRSADIDYFQNRWEHLGFAPTTRTM